MKDLLISLGLIDPSSIVEYHPRVRDRNDIKVLRCQKSGIIFLSRSDHKTLADYENKNIAEERYLESKEHGCRVEGSLIKTPALDDAVRRAKDFKPYITGKKWLDFGTGYGEIFDFLGREAKSAVGIEPNKIQRDFLKEKGIKVYRSLDELEENDFEVVTLFHVFEHLTDPVGTLKTLKKKLAPHGKVIIEIPHGRDFLIDTLGCEAFKRFTFWSEHLILHTRTSLRTFIQEAGFTDVTIVGYQRYPLSNHLYWLAKGRPGGHKEWCHLNREDVIQSYESLLQSIDQTDTLIAIANP